MPLALTSSAFAPDGEIPARCTCDGEDRSPPLGISGVPEATRSLVLIMDDPDAPDPDAPRMVYVHWIVYDLPPDTRTLAEGVGTRAGAHGGRDGLNDWDRTGYGGPCPPIGRHRYFHKLYALDTTLGDLGAVRKDALLAAMQGHVIASAELVGTYRKR